MKKLLALLITLLLVFSSTAFADAYTDEDANTLEWPKESVDDALNWNGADGLSILVFDQDGVTLTFNDFAVFALTNDIEILFHLKNETDHIVNIHLDSILINGSPFSSEGVLDWLGNEYVDVGETQMGVCQIYPQDADGNTEAENPIVMGKEAIETMDFNIVLSNSEGEYGNYGPFHVVFVD